MWVVWLGNVWVRRALACVAVAAMLWAVREHYVRMGERHGVEKEVARSADDGEKERAEERQAVLKEIGAMRDEIAVIDARGVAVAKAVAQSAATAQMLSGAQQQAAREVAAIPESELHGSNRRALGESGEAAYSGDDERKIAACLVDRPLCEKRSVALGQQVDGLQEQLAGEQKARGLEQQQYQQLAGYAGELEKGYVALYNAIPRKRNWLMTVATLGVKGKAKRLGVPGIEELRGVGGKR